MIELIALKLKNLLIYLYFNFQYKFFISKFNNKKLENFIISYFFNKNTNFQSKKNFFYFLKKEKILNKIIIKKLFLNSFFKKDIDLTFLLLDNFDDKYINDINLDVSKENIFSKLHYLGYLHFSNYLIWLFFILIDNSFDFSQKNKNNNIENLLKNKDNILTILKHKSLINFFQNYENQNIILSAIDNERKPLIQNILLSLSVDNIQISPIIKRKNKI